MLEVTLPKLGCGSTNALCEWCVTWSVWMCIRLLVFLDLFFFFFCRNAVDRLLYVGVWEHSKKVSAQGLPLTFWPQGCDAGSLAHANANSGLVATWGGLPQPIIAKRFHPAADSKLEGHDQKVKGSVIIVIQPPRLPKSTPQTHPRYSMTSSRTLGVWKRTDDTGWAWPECCPPFSSEKSTMNCQIS